MIQRIQTLFLIAAWGLILSLFFNPLATIFTEDKVITHTEIIPLLIFMIISLVLTTVIIFSYKNRLFQIRICNLNSLILIAHQLWIVYLFFSFKKYGEIIFSITALFPIAASILTFIAMRYIARDEVMVMASSRLRSAKSKKKR